MKHRLSGCTASTLSFLPIAETIELQNSSRLTSKKEELVKNKGQVLAKRALVDAA